MPRCIGLTLDETAQRYPHHEVISRRRMRTESWTSRSGFNGRRFAEVDSGHADQGSESLRASSHGAEARHRYHRHFTSRTPIYRGVTTRSRPGAAHGVHCFFFWVFLEECGGRVEMVARLCKPVPVANDISGPQSFLMSVEFEFFLSRILVAGHQFRFTQAP